MELRTYLRVLRRGWAVVLAGLLIGVVVAVVQLATTPSTYATTTTLFVAAGQSRAIDELQQSAELAQNAASTFAQILDSGSDSRLVSQSPRPPGAPADVVTAEAPTSTTVVEITVTGTDPVAIAATANATAANSVRLLPLLQPRRNGLPLVTVSPLAPALPATTPVGPLADRVLTLDIAVGLAAGLAGAFLLSRLDRRLHRREDVQAVTAVPVLATVPRSPRGGTVPAEGPASALAESARVVRASLLHGGADPSGRVVLCPVARRPAGGAALAVELAGVIAESGRRVVLVDADPGHPLDGVDPDLPGLSDVLARRARATQVLRPTRHPGCAVLPGGTPHPDGPGIADPVAVGSMVRALERVCDQLVVHAPPVLTDPGTTILAGVAGRVVLLVEAGRTRSPELVDALEELTDAGADVLGIVLLERGHPDSAGRTALVVPDRSAGNGALSGPGHRARP